MIMFAMVYGYLPFEGEVTLDRGSDPVTWTPANVYHLYQHIAANPIKLPTTTLSQDGLDILLGLLQADPLERITMDEIWDHPWITSNKQATNKDST